MPRIAPAEAPYQPQIAAELTRIMPKGVEPLVLFRTLARSPRVFEKMFAGGLLDKGPLSLRQREIVIDRTTARLGCEYEWGVHIAFFAERVALDAEQVPPSSMDRPTPPAGRPTSRPCSPLSTISSTVARSLRRPGPLSRSTSTSRRSSRRSRWWATTTRSASSAADWNCRSKVTVRAFLALESRSIARISNPNTRPQNAEPTPIRVTPETVTASVPAAASRSCRPERRAHRPRHRAQQRRARDGGQQRRRQRPEQADQRRAEQRDRPQNSA